MEEIWKDIHGYEGRYQVSDTGRVRSLPRSVKHKKFGSFVIKGRIMKPGVHSFGYPFYNLFIDGRSKMHYTHTLILEAFVSKRPEGMVCCHGDGNPSHSVLSNLRWGTPAENNADMAIHGTRPVGERQTNSKLSEQMVAEIRSSSASASDLARRMNVCDRTIRKVRSNISWKSAV
jgi:hypothetical protein